MSARADDAWRVGDLAVCINRIGWALHRGDPLGWLHGPKPGVLLRVFEVKSGVIFSGSDGSKVTTEGLRFAEWPDRHFASVHFRRVKPDAEAGLDGTLTFAIKRSRIGADA